MKREDELEGYKKNLRSTKMQEQDYEIRTYKEELQRMRRLVEEFARG